MVHLLNGNVIPSMEEEAAAPYNAGQTLTFKCEKGFDIAVSINFFRLENRVTLKIHFLHVITLSECNYTFSF